MQQPQVTVYSDIGEVRLETRAAGDTSGWRHERLETRAAGCNQLLAEGWVLLGVYPLTTLGEMAEGRSRGEQEQKQPQDTQRYVRRLVGYVVGKRRE